MDKRNYIAYCGLYCEICPARNRTPKKAQELLVTLKKGEFEEWGPGFKEFDHFWKLLNKFADLKDDMCCKANKCGNPKCAIRNCAKKKNMETCALCDAYPCDMITSFAKSMPLLIHDGNRIKKMGTESWILEQEERKNNGFSYEDVKCGKSDIPLDKD